MTAVTLAPAWVDDDLGYSDFYARYHRPLTCYLRMGFRDADVEAVVQETFCRALARWSEVRNMAAPWPWLAVTSRNLARNNIRDELASRPAGLDVFHPATSSREDVAEQVEASEALRQLAQAMTVLTPLQKRLVTVMVEEGLTGAQLARRLDMRPGAVRMHLCRMRLRLGERFAALGGMLGIGPLALLPALVRRLTRPRRLGAQQIALTAGSTALAFSAAVVAVAIGGGAFGGGTAATANSVGGRQVLTSSDTPAVHAVSLPVRAQSRPAAPSSAEATAPVVYRAELSSTPTKTGKTADIWISVNGPAGRAYVGVTVIQGSAAEKPPPGPCVATDC